ncbi:S9 family peptidase [Steroidobacter sp.]|uniref:S9 family peptidase n=1 Tax=Steroidobacter sp. TaxID=1978227 RepID=UPI001A36568F|nr:DPP IV N-terminal domain-containing protein [Steroidobacter sp.]MBL8265628.1 DPP IV N-terminal domain-containing protein [Steroidobacter sp.]
MSGRGLKIFSVLVALGLTSATVADDLRSAYQRAEALLPINALRGVHGLYAQPNWIDGTDRFWYRRTSEAGSEFVRIDAARNERGVAFDHARLAQALSSLAGKRYEGSALPFESFEYRRGERDIRVRLDDQTVDCDLKSYVCTKVGAPAALLPGEVESPDGRWAAFTREHDLYVRSLVDGRERRLTEDGVKDYGYAEFADAHLLSITAQLSGNTRPARVLWSPDSTKLVSYRVDQRAVPEMPYVQWAPPEGYGTRPKLFTARVPMPADEKVTTAKLVIFELPAADADKARRVEVDAAAIPMAYDLIGWGLVWWDERGRQLFHIREERGYREVSLSETNSKTGATRLVMQERVPTYVLNDDYDRLRHGFTGSRLHWLSTQDGWRHLYRYDLASGRQVSQVTRGEWAVDRLMYAEQGEGWVYFTAGGREAGLDPYFLQLYRARPDGSRLQRLTPEAATHDINFSPSGKYFVDRYSRVDLPPVTVLRRADGRLLRTLEQADVSALMARGRQQIERFHAKGRDGVTDIYGTLYRPSNFDPNKRSPVLDDIYGGPQLIKAARAFALGSPLAELGFINVQIDGMGTPGRSKAFQDVSYGTGFAEAGGLEDHIAVLKSLAKRYPWMDLTRVGIYGHSGGGYSSTRAMLDYPDFYKVAVSSAGSHDQFLYQLEWGERFIGRPGENPAAYELQANSRHVAGLRGKLLLAHGDLDDDVPLVNTMQLADALIKANKDFDLLIVPGTNHSSLGSHPYFIRRQWDYFVQHLMGAQPPADFRVGEP